MKADDLAKALHGYTGEVGHDAQGRLYVPALANGRRVWVPLGTTMPIWYGVPDPTPAAESVEQENE